MRAVMGMAVLALAIPARAQAPAERSLDDTADLTLLARQPQALEAFERGERLLEQGDARGALDALKQARDAAPESAVVVRTHCRALSELGRRKEAVAACDRALELSGSVENLRFAAGALTVGTEPLSVEELARAVMFARGAELRAPQQPWGYAASLDIAERLGDPLLRDRTLETLRSVAPNHPETLRAERRARATRRTHLSLPLVWGLLLAGVVGTAVHAFARRSRRRQSMRTAAVALVMALSWLPGAASAADPAPPTFLHGLSRWPINERDPLSSVPTAAQRDGNPVEYGYHIMDLLAEAARATRRGDHVQAAQLYMAVAKAAPDRAVGFSKACESFELAGNRQRALEACGVVVARQGVTVADYTRFARLVFQKEGKLDAAETTDIAAVVAHLRAQNEPDAALDIECELGLRTNDAVLLRGCVAALEKRSPDAPRAISHAWALALLEHRYADADRLLERARKLGVKPDALDTMERATAKAEPFWWRVAGTWQRKVLLAGWLVVFVALAVAIRRAAGPRRVRSALAS
jgi:tetratricopeptide (TPR) repeat protein